MEHSAVRFTSFLGGQEASEGLQEEGFISGAGAFCSLLEVGRALLLLDCGLLSSFSTERVERLRRELLAALGGRRLDAVLVTHADLAHAGALPYICGSNGPCPGVPIICTLPVLKMSHMVLYDYFLNLKGEKTRLLTRQRDSKRSKAEQMLINSTGLDLTLDDIDDSLENHRMIKFGQRIEIVIDNMEGKVEYLSVCAESAGRTIGGTSWIIRQVDINLKKELTVDGASINNLPLSPSLMIVETGHEMSKEKTSKKDKKKEEGTLLSNLLSSVMDTVRLEGSVLIPVETVGRSLELMYILGKFWEEKKLGGMYHLVYLSPMAHNVVEYAKSQLEWMPDSLSRDFYLGRSNPFALTHLNTCSSVHEVMALGAGPKVVLATSASLSEGLSKELLLRWGGNPSCRIIFTDKPEAGSLSSNIRDLIARGAKSKDFWNEDKDPIVVTVSSAQRVLLEGSELEAFQQMQEEEQRRQEEMEHRNLREKELATLIGGSDAIASQQLPLTGADDMEDAETSDESDVSDFEDIYTPSRAAKRKRAKVESAENVESEKSTSFGRIAQYATPRFKMFETRDRRQLPDYVDEYGLDNSDLNFLEIVTSTALVPRQGKMQGKQLSLDKSASSLHSEKHSNAHMSDLLDEDEGFDPNAPPSRIISKSNRVQLTCAFKEIPPSSWGRLDLKGAKTLINKCSPRNLVLLCGSNGLGKSNHVQTLKEYACKLIGASKVYLPAVNQIIEMQIPTDRFKIIIQDHYVQKGLSLVSIAVLQIMSGTGLISGHHAARRGLAMSTIPPNFTADTSNRSFSIGPLSGHIVPLSKQEQLIGSGVNTHDGIISTKWQSPEISSDDYNEEGNQNKIEDIQSSTDVALVEEDDVADWAQQYFESINRNKLSQASEDTPSSEMEVSEEKEDEDEGEFVYDESYDVFEAESMGQDASSGMEDSKEKEHMAEEYACNDELYQSSFLSASHVLSDSMQANGLKVGSISAGEVQLQMLQQELEKEGVTVEHRLGKAGSGAMLVCGGQVIIRKSNKNDFVLEGPPCNAFDVVKKSIYKRFTFI